MSALPAGMDEEQFTVDEDMFDTTVNVAMGQHLGSQIVSQDFPYLENMVDFLVNVALATPS